MDLNPAYHLRPALDEDKHWLEALRRGVYQELFVATFGGWDEARHQRQFAECWAEGGIFVVELGTQPVGMLKLAEHAGAIEIGEVQVQQSHQGRGLGSRVLSDAIARAHASGKNVRLSLGLKNYGAHRLYRRLGFRDTEQTETHYHMVFEAPVH